jgi:hypothetical protein
VSSSYETADAVAYLLSGQASFITGAVIPSMAGARPGGLTRNSADLERR